MTRFLESLITGLANGGVYVLIALAFSIIYMTTRIINFAQGEILMVGAMIYYAAAAAGGLPWPVALLITMIGAAVAALIVQLIAVAPLGKFDPNTNIGWILTTLATSLLLVEFFRIYAGEQQRPIKSVVERLGGRDALFNIAWKQYLVLVVGVLLAVILEIVHSKTQLGRALRATAHDRATASLMGINTTFMVLYSFGLAGVLAGVGGWLLAPLIFVSSNMGTLTGLKAFVAAVVGGIGSTRGALVGGLTIGVVEQMARYAGAGEWAEAMVFLALILILVLRPTGILGEALIEKV
jgi:branched-chain amino acid transport system permease protein